MRFGDFLPMRTLWEDHYLEFECHYRSIVNISEDSMNVHAHPLRPQQKICIVSKSLSFARILLGGEVTLYNVVRRNPVLILRPDIHNGREFSKDVT